MRAHRQRTDEDRHRSPDQPDAHGQAEADGFRSQHLSACGCCHIAQTAIATSGADEGQKGAQPRWGTDAVCFCSQEGPCGIQWG